MRFQRLRIGSDRAHGLSCQERHGTSVIWVGRYELKEHKVLKCGFKGPQRAVLLRSVPISSSVNSPNKGCPVAS